MMSRFAAAAAFAVWLAGSAAAAQEGAAGVLACLKNPKTPGSTYFFFSRHPVTCTYHGFGGPETYRGTSGILFGFDLEYRMEDAMFYLVVGARSGPDALAGRYTGAKASGRLGGGVSAQAGLAGAGNGVFLVPLGIGGGTGVGASAGLSYLELAPSK
jgi:hypothetical protein